MTDEEKGKIFRPWIEMEERVTTHFLGIPCVTPTPIRNMANSTKSVISHHR